MTALDALARVYSEATGLPEEQIRAGFLSSFAKLGADMTDARRKLPDHEAERLLAQLRTEKHAMLRSFIEDQ